MRALLTGILAVALLLCLAQAAAATPVTVDLRIEGSSGTTFEGPITTDAKTIDGHPCDGTNAGVNPTPGPTMTSALDDASLAAGFAWARTWFAGFEDFGIDSIGPDATDFVNNRFWGYALNYTPTLRGGCQQRVGQGDEVLFGYDFFSKDHLLKLDGPSVGSTDSDLVVSVTNGDDGSAASGATVAGKVTDGAGKATLRFAAPGVYKLKAERAGSLRSNTLEVCVSPPGRSDCKNLVSDQSAPVGRIAGIRSGSRYRKRGPRVLKGTAQDAGGISQVKLSLRRHKRGCAWWSKTSERFSGKNCRRKVFFAIGSDARWSYQLPRALGPGRYVLDVKAYDKNHNVDSTFERGRNRVVFRVGRKHAKRHARISSVRPHGVDVMVIGKAGKVLAAARTVRAKAVTVQASKRRCRVLANTPLAALVAAVGKRRLKIKDFGSCSARRARDSAQLFVRSIKGQRNRGADGWVYKLGKKIPAIGAADRTARVGGKARLYWLYCVHDRKGACQPSLDLDVLDADPQPGGLQTLRVRSLDDNGRSKPLPGATVGNDAVSSRSDADGIVRVALPEAVGRRAVFASMPGALPSFPVTLGQVRAQ